MQIIRVAHRMDGTVIDHRVDDYLVLPYNMRRKARQRVKLQSGREAGLFLPCGTILRSGDILATDKGLQIRVVDAEEKVSVARVSDHLQLAKIAYHLGNRHVAVRILEDRLIYLHDHVLDDMVRGLGATVTVTDQPFEPETGAYHGGGHRH